VRTRTECTYCDADFSGSDANLVMISFYDHVLEEHEKEIDVESCEETRQQFVENLDSDNQQKDEIEREKP